MYDTLAWERIGWLILKLGHLTCMLPKDEKAKPLWCQVGFYIAVVSVLGWLDKGYMCTESQDRLSDHRDPHMLPAN